jgi:hypothetical protein
MKTPAGFAEAFASENRLAKVGPEAVNPFSFERHRPAWFAPKPPAAYTIWSAGTNDPSCYVLLDRQSSDIFIYALQL